MAETAGDAAAPFPGPEVSGRTCPQPYLGGKKLELTPTEFSFAVYLVKNSGRAVSRVELLRSVWRFEAEVDTRVTDDAVKRLRKKLKDSRVRIMPVWGYGFKLETTEEGRT